jgi:hypothetical protein
LGVVWPPLGALHPTIYEEVNRMAKSKGKKGDLDLRPYMEKIGLKKYLAAVDIGDIVDNFGPKKFVKEIGIERFMVNLTAEDRQKLKELLK